MPIGYRCAYLATLPNAGLFPAFIRRPVSTVRRVNIPTHAAKSRVGCAVGDGPQIARALGHDVAQHVRIASMYTSLLARGQLAEDQRDQVEIIAGQLDRLHMTIAGLVRWLRLAETELMLSDCDLNRLWADATADLEGEFTHDPLPILNGDQDLLIVLLRELAINAVRYQLSPIRVHLRAELNNLAWQITISDRGPGIPASHHDQMLLPLHRLHTWEDIPGIGMGLAVAQRIAQRHGGSLRITDGPDGGCMVQVAIPA